MLFIAGWQNGDPVIGLLQTGLRMSNYQPTQLSGDDLSIAARRGELRFGARPRSSDAPGWRGDWSGQEDNHFPPAYKAGFVGRRKTFFYPLLRFSPFIEPATKKTTIAFTTQVDVLEITPAVLRADATAWSGAEQSLFNRSETQVRLVWATLDKATLDKLFSYWQTYGGQGLATQLILDRLNTCAGQWEYDQFNTFFSTAKLVQLQFAPRRPAPSRLLYTVELIFRQEPPQAASIRYVLQATNGTLYEVGVTDTGALTTAQIQGVPTRGMFAAAPNGTWYILSVDNNGALRTATATGSIDTSTITLSTPNGRFYTVGVDNNGALRTTAV